MTTDGGARLLDAAPAGVELWQLDLDAAAAAHADDVLSDAERARAARFAFERDRRRYVAAHCGLRALLARRTRHAPGALQFAIGEFGKPSLAGVAACTFNLSHCEDLGLVGIATHAEIGVDVEIVRNVPDAAELAARWFTAAECAALEALPVLDRDRAFLVCWTRKEACLKAIGAGLTVAPESIEVGIAPEPTAVHCAQTRQSVQVHSMHLGDRAIAAVATVTVAAGTAFAARALT